MYIIDHKKQVALISEMKQLRQNAKRYEVYYHHPYTNQMWKGFFPKAEGDDLGPKLLRHEPMPNLEDCLHICLQENAPENAIGLGIEWSAKPELWPSIIQALEKEYAHYNRTQLKLFLKHLDMDETKEKVISESEHGASEEYISEEKVNNLIWRTKKIRMKRFFVLG